MFNPYLTSSFPPSDSPKPLGLPDSLRRFTLSESDCSFSFLLIVGSARNDFSFSSLYRFQGSPLSFPSAVSAVLATTLMIIANPLLFVNPFFATFPTHNFSRVFASFSTLFSEYSLFSRVLSYGKTEHSFVRPFFRRFCFCEVTQHKFNLWNQKIFGCICRPSRAADTVSGIISMLATRESGLPAGSS